MQIRTAAFVFRAIFYISSIEPIIVALIRALRTPPTPNAGAMRAIRAPKLGIQSLLTRFHLSLTGTGAVFPFVLGTGRRGRLYKSSPSRWIGVETICTAEGITNCATFAFATAEGATKSGIEGASRGGRLNDAKIVRESRAQNRPSDDLGIGGGLVMLPAADAAALPALSDGIEALWSPKNLANLESL